MAERTIGNCIKASVLLILMLVLTITGCSKETDTPKEYGTVSPIDSESETDYSEHNLFTPLEEPLGYQYITFENSKARFSLQYPKKWFSVKEDSNHFIMASPEDEALLKDVTIHIVTDHDSNYEDPSTDNAIKVFSNILPLLPFELNNKAYVKLSYDNPESYLSAENIIENSPETLLITMDEDMQYTSTSGNLITNGEKLINRCYYINWQNRPTLVFAVGKSSDKDNLCSLLDYMVSTIQYIDNAGISKTKKIETIKDAYATDISLPFDWEITKMNTKGVFDKAIKYAPPAESTSPYAGMTAAVYSADRSVFLDINKEYIKENLLNTFALNYYSESISEADFNNDYFIKDVSSPQTLGGKTCKEFEAHTLIRKTNNNASTVQDLTIHYSEILVLYDEDNVNVIVLSYRDSQVEDAKSISELLRATLSVKEGDN